MTVVGVVPARGGSKGIPNKNLALLAGRPLLAYTAEAVRTSRRLSRCIVSTDDERIAEAARSLGLEVPFLRPSELASDDTPMLPVLQHAAREIALGPYRELIAVISKYVSIKGEDINSRRMRASSVNAERSWPSRIVLRNTHPRENNTGSRKIARYHFQ